jgi:hypothetical protein
MRRAICKSFGGAEKLRTAITRIIQPGGLATLIGSTLTSVVLSRWPEARESYAANLPFGADHGQTES